jgi:hypothetical protein
MVGGSGEGIDKGVKMSLTVEVVLYACLVMLAVMSWGLWSAEKEIEKLQNKIDFLEDENDELDAEARYYRDQYRRGSINVDNKVS